MKDFHECTKHLSGEIERKKTNCTHVLIVDDEDYLVKLWKNVLEKRGYMVSGFTDGKLALDAFKTNPESFDIVVTDHSMPAMTGSEFVTELFKVRNNIKIILCTGYLEEFSMENVASIGICEFLLKPFDNSTLIKAISRNL